MAIPDPTWVAQQVEEFSKEQPIYLEYADFLRRVLSRVADIHAPMALVQARAKAIDSFAGKAARKAAIYIDPCHQLTDLAGARVITLTQEETDRVCDTIRGLFTIDEVNSEDKRAELAANQFGYVSVHFIVQVPPRLRKLLDVPIPKGLGNRTKRLLKDLRISEMPQQGCRHCHIHTPANIMSRE